MRKFIRTIQSLSERAAELQQTMQQVPPKVAGIRQAITMTTGQLQRLQADVHANVASLKADGQDRLVAALHEINGSTEVFEEAGYELGRVEMDLTPVPGLIVHLNRFEDVPTPRLQSLAAANQGRSITHALLNAVIQAEAMADQVDIRGQVYYELVVHIGPVPAVRLGWIPEAKDVSARENPPVAPGAVATVERPTKGSLGAYGQDSFFQDRSMQTSGVRPVGSNPAPSGGDRVQGAAAEEVAVPLPEPASPSASMTASPRPPRSASKGWGRESLDRFKKMPGISKYQR